MLKLDNVSFSYGTRPVLSRFSMQLEKGELLALMGPSGCGKSTLLSLIAGLRKPAEGTVTSDFSGISFVFQEPRLFPWMTARENVRTVCGGDGSEAEKWLARLGLADAMDKYPAELSGGMKQRVSIARALAYGADVLLLDEPFGGLDAALRLDVTRQVMEAFAKKTVIMVTHDESDLAYADVVYRLTPPPESRLEEIKR